jgi:predicted anti-sigma-YlaC factor YlaD
VIAEQCPRENELLDAHARGYVGPELSEHIATCASCGELHLVAGALLDEKAEAYSEAHVPSAGSMLFRMQTRRRREAQATARQALLIGQALTLAVSVAAVVFFFGEQITAATFEIIAAIKVSTPLLLTVATSLLLLPIAGWVAVRQK